MSEFLENQDILKLNASFNDLTAFKGLEKNLLEQLKRDFDKEKTIGDELLESFYFIYKNPLLEALNQIDKHEQKSASNDSNQLDQNLATLIKTSTEVSSESRMLYQVKGSIGIYYYIFPSFSFCTCSSFKYNVLNRKEFVYCKHIILVKLLDAMNKLKVKHVKNIELIEILKQIH